MIGEKVRQFRKSHQLTIAALAEMLGVSESYISQLESGRIDPSVSMVRKLAAAFQVPIAALFDAEYEEPIVNRLAERVVTEHQGLQFSQITSDDPAVNMKMLELSLDPSSTYHYEKQDFYTCILVTSGSFRIEYPGTEAELHEGDSIYIPSQTAVSITNPNAAKSQGLLCVRRDGRGGVA